MKKGRDFMKRKRLLSAMLAGIFAVSMLGGCASAGTSGCNGDHAGQCTGDGQDERNGKTESVGRGINV